MSHVLICCVHLCSINSDILYTDLEHPRKLDIIGKFEELQNTFNKYFGIPPAPPNLNANLFKKYLSGTYFPRLKNTLSCLYHGFPIHFIGDRTNLYQVPSNKVESVDGFAMLINKNKFNDNIYFDENFFLYLENDDLCLRKKKENNKIYVAKKAKVQHLGAGSHSPIYEKEIEFSRNWHWMWSKFYFNKKHYSYSKAILIGLPALINSMIKLFYYFITHNKFKKKVYTMRFLGLINSMFGKKSWYRPQI